MSIKPVDLQVMLPRTNEIAKINSEEQQRNQLLQQQQANTIQHEAEKSVRYVHSQEDVKEAKIREKEEKERKQEKRKNKGNYNSKSEKEEELKTSTIDIRL